MKLRISKKPAFAALVAMPLFALGQQEATRTITAEEIQGHVNILASDQLEGRDSGHKGCENAAIYITDRLEAAGLKPLLEDWQMPFEIRGARQLDGCSVEVGGWTFDDPKKVAPPTGAWGRELPSATVTGPATTRDLAGPGTVVIVPGTYNTVKDRPIAIELGKKEVAAVIFVTNREELRVRRRGDSRRMGGFDDDGIDDQEQRRSGGGLMPQTADDDEVASEAETPNPPTVYVSRDLSVDLMDAADSGEEITISLAYSGKNESANVIGVLEGSDPELKNEFVIVGAHYDHVGKDNKGNIWNGADDNASGTSGVLEFADALASLETPPRRSVVLALWSAEERGLVGSTAFVEEEKIPYEKIVAYFNMDMIGRNDPEFVEVIHSSEELYESAREAASLHGLEVNEGAAFYLNASDTGPFVAEEIPTLFPFTGTHDDYHMPSDDPHTIDAKKAERVARLTFDVMMEIADSDRRPEYTRTQVRRGRQGGRGGRRLGFMPGDAGDTGGILVRSVSEDSVAEKSGLQEDDIVVRIGTVQVRGFRDLRNALNSIKAGESFEVEVIRDDEPLVLEAVFEE